MRGRREKPRTSAEEEEDDDDDLALPADVDDAPKDVEAVVLAAASDVSPSVPGIPTARRAPASASAAAELADGPSSRRVSAARWMRKKFLRARFIVGILFGLLIVLKRLERIMIMSPARARRIAVRPADGGGRDEPCVLSVEIFWKVENTF